MSDLDKEAPTRVQRKGKQVCPFPFKASSETPHKISIDATGDVILHFEDEEANINVAFRCSSTVLRSNSPYFNTLLDPTKFSEGRKFQQEEESIVLQYGDLRDIPFEALPRLLIPEVGDLPQEDGHCLPALAVFLQMLHGVKISVWDQDVYHRVHILTLLSIIADRFAATTLILRHVEEKLNKDERYFGLDVGDESFIRRKLLVAFLLGLSFWVKRYTARLVCRGSQRWQECTADSKVRPSSPTLKDDGEALWWRLPHGVEEELLCRHQFVLETIGSIPKYFLNLYVSTDRQCTLYYENSRQCDLYQLGEMIRFLSRKELLYLDLPMLLRTSATSETSTSLPTHDVHQIICKLKEIPEYQVDRNHIHCGLRVRMLPLLEVFLPAGQVGICLQCWRTDRMRESWAQNPSGGTWVYSKERVPADRWMKCHDHMMLKLMYTADVRNWAL